MTLDLSTLLATMSFIIVPLAAVFFIDKLRRPPEGSGRYWALVFISALLCSISYFISGHTDDVWWSVVVGNASMVFTLGALWLGCRAFNRRRTFVLLVAVITLAVAVTSTLPSAEGSKWAGAPEKMLALGLFSVLVVVECLRPRLRGFAGAWLLAAVLGVHAVYVLARSATYLVAGHTDPVFVAWFSTETVTAMNVVLVLLGGIGVIAIRVQDARLIASRRGTDGQRRHIEGPAVFRRHAVARIDETQAGTVLVVLSIDLFAQLRGAYGLAHATGLQESLTRAVVARAPDDALIGRLPGDRIGVLLPAGDAARDGIGRARAVAEAVQLEYATENRSPAATAVSAGIAAGAGGFELLLEAAGDALVLDPERGLGRIGVAVV